MTFPISNSTPPAEVIALKNDRPERLVPHEAAPNPPDGSVVSELSQAVATALAPHDQKIEALRQQVADGTYVIDPQKVAEKMLDAVLPK